MKDLLFTDESGYPYEHLVAHAKLASRLGKKTSIPALTTEIESLEAKSVKS